MLLRVSRRKHVAKPATVVPDKTESFVIRKCGLYLGRLLKRYPLFNREVVECLCWVLGPETTAIAAYLKDLLEKRNGHEFDEDLLASLQDPDDLSNGVIQALQKLPRQHHTRVLDRFMRTLQLRTENLRYRGQSDLEKSLFAMQRMFDLTDREREFCEFLFIISVYSGPERFFDDHLGCLGFPGRKHLLAILDMHAHELNQILGGQLQRIELLEFYGQQFRLNDGYHPFFQNPSPDSIQGSLYVRLYPRAIPLSFHLIEEKVTEFVLGLLKVRPETSTHILLYGPPGTGKTSYAHGLLQRLKVPSYDILQDERSLSNKRRTAIFACINMTNTGEGSIILVDEADNLLNTGSGFMVQGETHDKGGLNRLLETPGARIIWITNRIDDIEDSVLRRFAFSIHFRPFNRKQRTLLWRSVLRHNRAQKLLNESEIKEFAERYKVSAGAVDLAVKKTVEVGRKNSGEFHETVNLVLDSHRTLMHRGEKLVEKDSVERDYSIEGLNARGDLDAMLDQLTEFDRYLREADEKTAINFNLLFYGPPGTGKSELARYIAHRLGREILCKRASDILNAYVGATEANIKMAFQEAEAEEAVLVIDEADSLLFNRDRAVRSWEISFTNEFLAQMERFRGILICTTNRLGDLDSASLRRFNHKVEFDYLTADGVLTFYRKFFAPMISSPVDERSKRILLTIYPLAPGDFKVVRDRCTFSLGREISHADLVRALREEAAAKMAHRGGKCIGF